MGAFFQFDGLLDENDLCNMHEYREQLWNHVKHLRSVKLYGRRNFGKTSVVRNVIQKEWSKSKPKRISIYCDFYAASSISDIAHEMTTAFAAALKAAFPASQKIQSVLQDIKNIRPVYQITESGLELSLKQQKRDAIPDLPDVFASISALCKKRNLEILLIFDEFQEIVRISKAQAIFRSLLESMPVKKSVIILGSKTHLLDNIFSKPAAPFYQWGYTVEIHEIPHEIYHRYAQQRLKKAGVSISFDDSVVFQDRLLREPEAMNRFFDYVGTSCENHGLIKRERLLECFERLLDDSRSKLSVTWDRFSANERCFLSALALSRGADKITGSNFAMNTKGISREGARKILKRLMDDGIVISIDGFYTISDPYLCAYILKYWTRDRELAH